MIRVLLFGGGSDGYEIEGPDDLMVHGIRSTLQPSDQFPCGHPFETPVTFYDFSGALDQHGRHVFIAQGVKLT